MTSQLSMFDLAPTAPEFVDNGAVFSHDRRYRTRLWRTWDRTKPGAVWCMLNPSEATETKLDKTLTRCYGFSREWGYGAMMIVNLFALVDKHPEALTATGHDESIGVDNDRSIMDAVRDPSCGVVIAGFGAEPIAQARGATVVRAIAEVRDVHALGRCKGGAPRHPLYLAANTRPVLYMPRTVVTVASGCGCGADCGAICEREMRERAGACGVDWDAVVKAKGA